MRMNFNMNGYHNYYNNQQYESEFAKNLNKETLKSRDTSKAKAKKASLKTWGTVLLCIGIALFVIGFIGFATSGMAMVRSFGRSGVSPVTFWAMCAIAIPFIAVGSVLLGLSRQIIVDLDELRQKYETQNTNVGSNTTIVNKKICDYCGSESDDGSKYCSSCGAPLKSKKK